MRRADRGEGGERRPRAETGGGVGSLSPATRRTHLLLLGSTSSCRLVTRLWRVLWNACCRGAVLSDAGRRRCGRGASSPSAFSGANAARRWHSAACVPNSREFWRGVCPAPHFTVRGFLNAATALLFSRWASCGAGVQVCRSEPEPATCIGGALCSNPCIHSCATLFATCLCCAKLVSYVPTSPRFPAPSFLQGGSEQLYCMCTTSWVWFLLVHVAVRPR